MVAARGVRVDPPHLAVGEGRVGSRLRFRKLLRRRAQHQRLGSLGSRPQRGLSRSCLFQATPTRPLQPCRAPRSHRAPWSRRDRPLRCPPPLAPPRVFLRRRDRPQLPPRRRRPACALRAFIARQGAAPVQSLAPSTPTLPLALLHARHVRKIRSRLHLKQQQVRAFHAITSRPLALTVTALLLAPTALSANQVPGALVATHNLYPAAMASSAPFLAPQRALPAPLVRFDWAPQALRLWTKRAGLGTQLIMTVLVPIFREGI